MKGKDKQYSLTVCKRNLKVLSSAIDVCEKEDAPKGLLQELNYLFDELFKLMVRFEALPEGSSAEDAVFNQILALTLPLINAYEHVWRMYPKQLGEFYIASPGPVRSAPSKEAQPNEEKQIH